MAKGKREGKEGRGSGDLTSSAPEKGKKEPLDAMSSLAFTSFYFPFGQEKRGKRGEAEILTYTYL